MDKKTKLDKIQEKIKKQEHKLTELHKEKSTLEKEIRIEEDKIKFEGIPACHCSYDKLVHGILNPETGRRKRACKYGYINRDHGQDFPYCDNPNCSLYK